MYEIFAALLKEKGVKTSDVVKATGISSSMFTDWKMGRYHPKHDKMIALASYFGVSVEYLEGTTEERTPQKPQWMQINIEKVIIKDRIRKDFGDIEELAEDIRQNGLINPPVINKDNVLLAGERRLLACKALGWKDIEVRVMDTRDAEHELNVEISENESRKEFSKAERADYMRRLMRIEQAKAKERMSEGGKGVQISSPLKTRDAVSEQFGISHDTMTKEIAIVEHKDLIPPEDFADWDEGKLSTNKVFQSLKSRVAQTDREIKFYKNRIATLEKQKTQTVEVVPDDYMEVKSKAKAYDAESKRLNDKLTAAYKKQRELEDQIRDLKEVTKEGLDHENLSENVYFFCTTANNFVGNVGGLVWLTEHIAEMPEKERKLFLKASAALQDFANVFNQNLRRALDERNGEAGKHDGYDDEVGLYIPVKED